MKIRLTYFCFLLVFCISATAHGADEQSDSDFPHYQPPPFDSFSAMVQRPLFLASRRPLAVIKPAIKKPPAKRQMTEKKINLSLSGVIHDGEEYIALVRKGAKGALVQLKKNKSIDGWKLLEIKPEEITLNKGANFTTVKLRDNKPVATNKKKSKRAAKIRAEKLRKLRLQRQKKRLSQSGKKRKN